jgi:hypothetical protein
LRYKQQEYFRTGEKPLTATEAKKLDELSRIEFLKSLQPLTPSEAGF